MENKRCDTIMKNQRSIYQCMGKGVEATDTGNIIKYACRWKKKNGIQDLEKILWYTQHLIDHLKNIEEENK